jgi:hypothetical protein
MDADHARRVADAEAAEASLIARLQELARRLDHARETIDLRARIGEHPFIAVGAALALGALLGMRKGGGPGKGSAIGAAVGLAVRLAKDYAVQRIVRGALAWWGDREVGASYDPSIESVLGH